MAYGGRRTVVAGWLCFWSIAAALGLSSCSQVEPTDFTAENRDGFLEACTRPLTDSRVTTAICTCVFAETSGTYDFAEFQELDAKLAEDRSLALPADLASIVADCVIEEAEL